MRCPGPNPGGGPSAATPSGTRWLEPLNLDIDPHLPVGELSNLDRLRLRVLIGLVCRPDALALVVDDIDQLRSIQLTDKLVDSLTAVFEHLPVVALSVNDGTLDLADLEEVA